MSCFTMQMEYLEKYETDSDLIEMEFSTNEELPEDFVGHVSEDSQGNDWVVTRINRDEKRFWVCRKDRLEKLKVPVKLKGKHSH